MPILFAVGFDLVAVGFPRVVLRPEAEDNEGGEGGEEWRVLLPGIAPALPPPA